jgi:hypothetical protein
MGKDCDCGETFDRKDCRKGCGRDERFDCSTPWWWKPCNIRGTECSGYGRPWNNSQRGVGERRCRRALCCRRDFGYGGCYGGGCGGGYYGF